jgi:tRNA(His) 5'-end guanylyltransferase
MTRKSSVMHCPDDEIPCLLDVDFMDKFLRLLKSRGFWTVIVLGLINTIPDLKGMVSDQVLDVINLVLVILASYFKANPSVNLNTPEIQAQPIVEKK